MIRFFDFRHVVGHDHRLQEIIRMQAEPTRQSFGLMRRRNAAPHFKEANKRLMDADHRIVTELILGKTERAALELKSSHWPSGFCFTRHCASSEGVRRTKEKAER
jgi:hypothetical protein